MHGPFKIPPADIKKPRTETLAPPLSPAREIKMPQNPHPRNNQGRNMPHARKKKYFWYATRRAPLPVPELRGDRQPSRIISLSVDDADGLENAISAAIS